MLELSPRCTVEAKSPAVGGLELGSPAPLASVCSATAKSTVLLQKADQLMDTDIHRIVRFCQVPKAQQRFSGLYSVVLTEDGRNVHSRFNPHKLLARFISK